MFNGPGDVKVVKVTKRAWGTIVNDIAHKDATAYNQRNRLVQHSSQVS